MFNITLSIFSLKYLFSGAPDLIADMLDWFDLSYLNYGQVFIVITVIYFVILYFFYDKCGDNSYEDNYLINYNYDGCCGPSSWQDSFQSAKGRNQSPIHLTYSNCMIVPGETMQPLTFSREYFIMPREMRLYNNGYNVILYAQWMECVPYITGGPLADNYQFLNVHFRWGTTTDEGSEHMICYTRFAMEVQVIYRKSNCNFDNILDAASCGALLIISYLYQPDLVDNPFFEPIISALGAIQQPCSCAPIETMPLTLIAPNFSKNYFTYFGSLSFPPCTEGVTWMVQAEPLTISPKQVRQFRKICGNGGTKIISNVRPVQKIHKRDVFFYD